MDPTHHRNLTFLDLQAKVSGNRLTVLEALRKHGPATTRELAGAMGWEVLSVRPRLTELFQLGFVRCLDREGHEGTYEALTSTEARQAHAARQLESFGTETQLPLALA
jgi:predicted transcriptional regulator